jgi:large subunit ribosomal protein L9
MKVILLSDIPKVGKKSEVKNVSPGYAKNFLFPRGLAMLATHSAVIEIEHISDAKKKIAERELLKAEEFAQKMDGLEVEIQMKVSKEGVGYAAISSQKIAETLSKLGYKISKSQIKIPSPIKKIGEHIVNVSLPHDLEAEIKIIVIPEE